ncbi:hypothetical protein KR067_011051 [Drosophila pandora]|nr:hypothetical protein KR067_011051 [Drosophila pandora]
MDKRFKRPLNQKANYSDPPYHHNASRGYQKHSHPHGGHPHSHPHSHPHLHHHPNKHSRLQHGYSYQKGATAVGPNSYYKPPPPQHVQARNVDGGAMAPPSSGGNTSSDVVTLIVENNNLKRMIVLHLNLMQEQTEGLAAKDKELDDQNAKLEVILSQNQELKLANAKLEATVEDLRRQLRRKNKRPHDDDDDDDHSLPPTASQRQQILCNAGTQTEMQEVYNRIHPVEPFPAQQTQAKMQPRMQIQKEQLHEERLSHIKPGHKAPSAVTAGRPLESKVRGEFNGKKVSTMFLNRVNQDSSLTSAEHRTQEESDSKEEEETQQHKLEDIRLQQQEEEEQKKLVEEMPQDHEVILEEVVEDDIFHDALEPNEIEVATETIVGVDEEVITDANGHMDEENEDDSEDDSSDEDEEDDNEDGDTDDSDESEEEEEEQQLENNLDDFWNNQMNSMDLEEAEEKTIAPSGHSTPNHQPTLAEEEFERSTGSDKSPEPVEEEQVDQEIVVEQMEVDTVEDVTEEVVIDSQTTMEIEVHTEQRVSISRHVKLREQDTSEDEKNDCNILKDEREPAKTSVEDKQSSLKEEEKVRDVSTEDKQHRSPLKEEKKIRETSTDEKHHRSPLKEEKKIRETSTDEKQHRSPLKDEQKKRDVSPDEKQRPSPIKDEKKVREISTDEKQRVPKTTKEIRVLRDSSQDEEMVQDTPNDEGNILRTAKTEKPSLPMSTNECQNRDKKLNQSKDVPRNEKLNQSRETSMDGKLKRVSKDQKSQLAAQSSEEKVDVAMEPKKDTVAPKDIPKAVAPKAEIHPNPPSSETNLPKANSVAVSPTPKVIGASVQQSAPPAKTVANHQSNKPAKGEPVKKQRLQVKIRQHDMFNDKKVGAIASSISTRDQKKEKEPEITVNSTTKNSRDLDSSPMPKSEPEDDETLEERMRRKLQEHLQKEQRRQSQQVLLKKPSKESPTTHLIYPPIGPTSSAGSAATITPATTPTTTPSSTPVSTPHPTSASSQESSGSSTRSKQDKISLPLTPQSMSSVSSSSSGSIPKPTKVVNNCAPHTYSKAPSRSKKSKSLYRTAAYPYTTRSWEDQEFHCDNEFFLEEADELLADNPSLEIPKWRDDPVPPSSDKKGIEPLSDADFIRRHEPYVKDEIKRKRLDARNLKDMLRSEAMRSRKTQEEVSLPTSTFYPLPHDIEAIQFVDEVPVQAFGENMVNMEARDDFSLPWLDAVHAQTSIGKAKALAVPVATLASKKLPTNAKEARHQEMNSSYVYLKRRKRPRQR